ncbi:MAG: dethiobiotin synthase [Pedobacter sp.]|nr:dethiobiotin synthase [Pedobacter sp.]MDQ8052067.1 dethiobiotin synthase [Pedobacter sp.]
MGNTTYFITGIGTDVGKTVISAILTQKLEADYWKPVQSGDLDHSDTIKVKNLVRNQQTIFHPEAYRLNHPLSPHLSAKLDNVEIQLGQICRPETTNNLIIEGAGGLMVPLNDHTLILDLIKILHAPVILVSRNYLGSINHTLLTIETLALHQIPVAGIIFSGEPNIETENFILRHTGIRCLGKIPFITELNPESIDEAGKLLTL